MNEKPTTPDAGTPLRVSTRETARLCGLGLSTWWRLVSSGRTPEPVKLGRCTRWRADELRAWIEAGCPGRDRWEALQGGRR